MEVDRSITNLQRELSQYYGGEIMDSVTTEKIRKHVCQYFPEIDGAEVTYSDYGDIKITILFEDQAMRAWFMLKYQ